MKDRKKEESFFSNYLSANPKLAFFKTLAVIPTQPLQVVMRHQQSTMKSKKNSRYLTARQAAAEVAGVENVKDIKFSAQHLESFYKGITPAMIKESLKCMVFKGLLLKGAPDVADKTLNNTFFSLNNTFSPTSYHVFRSLTAGAIAGMIEVMLSNPIELWATYAASSHAETKDANLLKELSAIPTIPGKIRRVYQGSVPNIFKSSIGYATNFTVNPIIDPWVMKTYQIKEKKNAPWYANFTSAFLSAGVVATVTSPLDIIKTHRTKPGAVKMGIFQSLKENYANFGMKGFTAGLPLKFVMVTMGWTINNLVIGTPSTAHHPSSSPSMKA